jgi:hypothetical protein
MGIVPEVFQRTPNKYPKKKIKPKGKKISNKTIYGSLRIKYQQKK